jgi:hypothetical protein
MWKRTTTPEYALENNCHPDVNVHDLCGEFLLEVPAWIDRSLTVIQLAGIYRGGCASGSFMPPCEFETARKVMAEHGDDVIDYLHKHSPDFSLEIGDSWGEFCSRLLCTAIDCWAAVNREQVLDIATMHQ